MQSFQLLKNFFSYFSIFVDVKYFMVFILSRLLIVQVSFAQSCLCIALVMGDITVIAVCVLLILTFLLLSDSHLIILITNNPWNIGPIYFQD